MENKANQLSEDLLELASGIINCLKGVKKDNISNLLVVQLFRSVSSVGANYEEACGAQSRKDFIHKLSISFKELRETRFWIRLLYKSGYLSNDQFKRFSVDINKNLNILARSLITAKKNLNNQV